jgi:hypothetical protein
MRKVTVSIPVPDVHPIDNRFTRRVAVVPLTVVQVTKQKASHVRREVSDAREFRKESKAMRKASKAEGKKSAELITMQLEFEKFMACDPTDTSEEAWKISNEYQKALQDYVNSIPAHDRKGLKQARQIIRTNSEQSMARLSSADQEVANQLAQSLMMFAQTNFPK